MPEPSRPQTNLLSLTEAQMAALVRGFGWPGYRTGQILRWLYQRRARTIEQMTDLSQSDREKLTTVSTIQRTQNCTVLQSSDGTRKLLLTLDDGLRIETVLIPDEDRLTLCVSTQVGCMLDCGFCLTGTMGLKRNLKAHEIVDQVLTAQDQLTGDERLTNLVFMGMGEPLANSEALAVAIRCLTNKSWGLGWSPRRITVSTAGLATRLKDVAALGVNLAISLNGTTEEQRQQLMPAASQIASLKTLMAACRRYPLPPMRRLTFEYVLLAGVNDRDDDARRLVKLLTGIRCKVNLIPFNEFPGNAFRRPTDDRVFTFQAILTRAGIDTFIRKSRGRDVLGACGQLGNVPAGQAPVALTQIESRC
ncbi:MAG: 23S rRNA (adenine(2503)-C(2))-methyltransferase RlmN [Nitrospira sp.]|nr:MAG: 23S rRNA (adenine(2503)-C(2))-methyltransferase RlmN [Nitrospira sp. CG24D]TKB87727.1 MAG: 23S rRNA (adenine(2503)-C(2))-methyltransferase RlmN [Nitrospira sp.]